MDANKGRDREDLDESSSSDEFEDELFMEDMGKVKRVAINHSGSKT
jgi:hypothetical protein